MWISWQVQYFVSVLDLVESHSDTFHLVIAVPLGLLDREAVELAGSVQLFRNGHLRHRFL